MTEPTPAFETRPFDDQPRPVRRGCGTPLLIGCGVLVLLLGVGVVVFLLNAKKLFRWSLEQVEEQITARLPDEVTAAEAARLQAAFDAATRAVAEGEADPVALQQLQRVIMRLSRQGYADVTADDVTALIGALEEVAGAAGSEAGDRSPEAPEALGEPAESASPPGEAADAVEEAPPSP